jgi:hypothetical protein
MNRSLHSVHEDVSRELEDEYTDSEIRRLAEPSLERFTTVDEAKCAFTEVESSSKSNAEVEIDAADAKKAISRPSKTSTKDAEVDFYRNPTILSRLILNQKYASAITRLRKKPSEASVWVCGKRKPRKGKSRVNTPFSFRQLPIHFACTNLGRECDSRAQSTLNELITSLIVAYPAACREVDHKERLPLHEAISHGAMPETISMFLMAYPKSVHSPDKLGRTPKEINQYGTGECKKRVENMLSLDVDFWVQAHSEAILRLQHASPVRPSEDSQTIPSTSVLASSRADEESVSIPVEEDDGGDESDGDNEIASIAWEQLEERAISLEQILTEMNEKNYELNQIIEVLSKGKLALIDKLDRLEESYLAKEVTRLQKENETLNQEVYKMELLVREVVAPLDPEGQKRLLPLDVLQWTLSEESSRIEGQESLARKNVLLQQQYADLSVSYHVMQDRIQKLEMTVKTLAESATEADTLVGSHGSYGNNLLKIETSILTDPDQSISLGSSGGHEYAHVIGGGPQPPLGTHHLEVDWVPPTTSNLVQAFGTDDLSYILRAAARSEGLGKVQGSPLSDTDT